jgi:hypothetical protein
MERASHTRKRGARKGNAFKNAGSPGFTVEAGCAEKLLRLLKKDLLPVNIP